jgi:TAK1-binding protein 1
VSNLALSRIAADILLQGGLTSEKSDEDTRELLKSAFNSTEKVYFQLIDNLLANKQQLQFDISDLSQYEISKNYQRHLDRLAACNKELSVGSSVLVGLITNKKLYISNLGTCRALLVKNDERNGDILRVIQVTDDHNLTNVNEMERFRELVQDPSSLKSDAPTRCIGYYMGKGGYKDSEMLSQANKEPILSEADVIGPITIDDQCRFLLLLSSGLCKVLTNLYSDDLNVANRELVSMVVQQLNRQSTLVGVAQSVVNQISQLHHDLFMKSKISGQQSFNSRDDLTLIIRNFTFEMPNSIENSKSSTTSSTMDTNNTSYSSTNTSTKTYSYDKSNMKTKPYVSFDDYFANVEKARKEGKLPPNIEFD